jgi:CTP synthase
LLEYGIQPDILVCRTEHHISVKISAVKLRFFVTLDINAVIESIDASLPYTSVPLLMREGEFRQNCTEQTQTIGQSTNLI